MNWNYFTETWDKLPIDIISKMFSFVSCRIRKNDDILKIFCCLTRCSDFHFRKHKKMDVSSFWSFLALCFINKVEVQFIFLLILITLNNLLHLFHLKSLFGAYVPQKDFLAGIDFSLSLFYFDSK